MHGLTFEVKRAHWAATWFGIHEFRNKASEEKIVELEDMTPARFDILYLLHQQGRRRVDPVGYRMAQYEIRRALGLHRTTVSKLVTKMVELGFVTRRPNPFRRGSRMIALTERGIRAVRAALHSVFTEHRLRTKIEAYADRFVPRDQRHGRGHGSKGRFKRHPIMMRLIEVVDAARGFVEHFGKSAETVYFIDEETQT